MIKMLFLGVCSVSLILGQEAANLDTVLSGYYKALGGLEKIKSIKTLQVEGRTILPDMNLEIQLVLKKKYPNKFRVETVSHGVETVKGYDGKNVWLKNTTQDPTVYNEQDSRMLMSEADLEGPLVHWKAKGNRLEYLGVQDFDGTRTYKVKVIEYTGRIYMYYLDTRSFLPVTSVYKRKTETGISEMRTHYVEYKEVEGIRFASLLRVEDQNGKVALSTLFEKIELNRPMDEALFAIPKVRKD